MNGRHPGRRLRNFLIDSQLQLYYVRQMVGVSAVLTLGLGALVYHFNAEVSRVVEVTALDEETARLVHGQFVNEQFKLVVALAVFGALLCLVLGLWQVVTTHKIAGPLYYMKREMRKVRDGRFSKLHALRPGDMLHDFFDTFRQMHEAMRGRFEQEAALLARLAAEAEQKGDSAVAAELRRLAAEREAAIAPPPGSGSSG